MRLRVAPCIELAFVLERINVNFIVRAGREGHSSVHGEGWANR